MQWSDEGLILSTRRLGENDVILEALTLAHGRHFGVVKGGRGRRLAPALQPGNSVTLDWRARLDEHIGTYRAEITVSRAGRFIDQPQALHGLAHLAFLARLLPEREAHEGLYAAALVIVGHLDAPLAAAALLARFELALLSELGFGLDLVSCAATGAREELIYVSPKSGRAVSKDAGEPYRDRLLPLPGFLRDLANNAAVDAASIADAFALSGFFLERDVIGPRGLAWPEARGILHTKLNDPG